MTVDKKPVILKNKTEILLRSPLAHDADKILAHLRQAHLESYKNLNQNPEYWQQMTAEEEAKILEDFRQSKAKFLIAAEDKNKIVGALGVTGSALAFSQHSATLGVHIQKAYSGLGLGTELVKHALYSAKNLGFSRIDLTVRTYNEAGIKLYENFGFERVGLLKKIALIDGQYVDEYAYQLLVN